MDFAKYPLEKLSYFVASVVPGSVALAVAQVANPTLLTVFFDIGLLGYRTKIAIALAIAFLIGHTMTTLLGACLGGLGGAIGALNSTFPHFLDNAPWRDPSWRKALKGRLGAQAPNDTRLITKDIFLFRSTRIKLLPADEQAIPLYELQVEQARTQEDDAAWASWYSHYHHVVLKPDEKDLATQIRRGLTINMQSASVYVLAASTVLVSLRKWWVIVPAMVWTILLAAEVYTALTQHKNHWYTLDSQIRYLVAEQS